MDRDMIISIIVACVVFAFAAAIIIYEIVWFKKVRKKYFYRWQGHEIVVEIAARSVKLYVDGNVEDEFGARDICICTLRAFAEGTEIKARMALKATRAQIDVTAGTTPLQLIGIGK